MEFEDKTQVFDATKLKAAVKAETRAACLIVVSGSQTGRMFKLDGQAAAVIGRATDAPIRIEDDGVSRHHCKVQSGFDGRIYVEDLRSTNGTFLNGARVGREPLGDGDKLQLGTSTILKFSFQDALDEDFQRRQYEMATRDALTGGYNKKYFLERLVSEFSFAVRHKKPVCLVMFDIDHFKKVNDTHGHAVGDGVLQTLVRTCGLCLRRTDAVGRLGGEEFLILLPDTDEHAAAEVGERLRAVLASSETAAGQPRVTVSVGVASRRPDTASLEHLLKRADDALYAAKAAGRNQLRTAKSDALHHMASASA